MDNNEMNMPHIIEPPEKIPSDTGLGMAIAIREGRVSSEDIVEACIKQIDLHEDDIKAWAYLDPDLARMQAQNADKHRQQGHPLGPLHGIPVGIKDIIDTTGMPTEYNSPIFAGRKSGKDAALVSLLREAGAIIMGKTVTTEFALLEPAQTTNPHNT
ncbi:MAG: amidase, partial [Fimbriimonadaceae bacterium]|nr:amidase [Alphaproteobacteria bacterium]